MSNSPKKDKITPSDVKMLAEQCEEISNSLTFDAPILENKIIGKVKFRREPSRFSQLLEYTIPEDEGRDNILEIADEEKIFQAIKADIEKELNQIGELSVIEESVVGALRKWAGKKIVTASIIMQLLNTGIATAQQLDQAGFDKDKIEMAQGDIDRSKMARPQNFNLVLVKAIAINDEINKDDFSALNAMGLETYHGSDRFHFVDVSYKLETSKEFTKDWGSHMASSFNKFNKTVDVSTTGNRDLVTVGSEDGAPITYKVSEYPMEIQHGDTTLVFLGVEVIYGESRNKTALINTSKGVELAKTKENKKEFINAQGKTSVTVKANSASINLMYGQSVFSEKTFPDPLEMKSSSLFKYNSVSINTESSEYTDMIDSLESYINKNPEAKFDFVAVGSSSQVPTNYPTLSGEKTVEANGQLARDRALALGKQMLKDLQGKGVNVKEKISSKKITHKIGDIEYQGDADNVSRYLPDQYSGFTIKLAK